MSAPAAQPWPPDDAPQARSSPAAPARGDDRAPAAPAALDRLTPGGSVATRTRPADAPRPGGSGGGPGGPGGPHDGGRGGRRRPLALADITPRPGMIQGLEGLRAIAVLAVLVYHLAPGRLPGGFVGVDIFFVVSGFLITTLLLREIVQTGRIDLRGFWTRRARRLVPALVVVVVVSVLAARVAGGDLLVGIVRQAFGALTFSNNWVELAAGSSYAQGTSPQLFVNFWSLAVEEQFYLVWPFALLGLLGLVGTTRARIGVVAGVGAASALLMAVLVTPGEDPTRVYYGTDTHLFGLAAGIVLAFCWATPGRAGLRTAAWRRARPLAMAAAAAVLVTAMLWLSMSNVATFRGGLLLVCLATVVLIAGLLESGSRYRTFLSSPALGWVGQRSYGLYLWHWPVIVVVTEMLPFAPGTGRAVLVLGIAVVVSFVLTALSYRFVETPVRRLGFTGVYRRIRAYVSIPWQVSRVPRIVAGGVALLLVASAAAALSAPTMSQTQAQIERTEAELGAGGTLTGNTDTGSDGGAGEQAPALDLEQLLPGWPGALAPGADEATETDESTEGAQGDAAAEPEAEPEASPEASAEEPAEDGDAAGAADLSMPTGEEMTAIGDSLVVTSADGLEYAFPGITFVAQSNRQWGDAQSVLDQALADDQVKRAVIVHFGTNAGVDEAALRQFLDTLGPERAIVVMNLYVRADFTDSSNETIEKVVADYPNAIVGDWNAAATAEPEKLQSDQVHPDIEGMHLYADVVRASFEELAAR